MATIDLSKYGITDVKEVLYNPSYETLYEEETKSDLTGFDRGVVTEMGAVNVMTGVYTGRSPKDKFFVMDDVTKDTIWWTSDEYKNDNKPVSQETWSELKKLAAEELSSKKLYVMDTFCGANENTRLKIRFIMEVAWQAHFVKNMFIRPTEEELANYGEPDFVVLNASKAKVENYKELGLNSETAVVFNLTEKMQVILNTWYGGEMKKGMFSYMNYLLPLKGIASMHCSANTNEKGETAIFFGLSTVVYQIGRVYLPAAGAVGAQNAAVKLQHLLAAGSLMQTVNILSDDGPELAPLFKLGKLQVSPIGHNTVDDQLFPVKTVILSRVTDKKAAGEDSFGRVLPLLVIQSVHAAEIRNSRLCTDSGTAEKNDILALVHQFFQFGNVFVHGRTSPFNLFIILQLCLHGQPNKQEQPARGSTGGRNN